MKIIFVSFFVVLFIGFKATAQTIKNTEHLNQLWFSYFNQTRFSNKWGIWTDVSLRTKEDFVNNLSLSIVRIGVTYYIADNIKLTTGYAWANYFPGDNHKNISQREHRLWQQIQWDTKYRKKRMVHWIRLEERFRHKILNDSTLKDGYTFNYRIRYNLRYELPLDKKGNTPGAITIIINDEINVNAGKQIVYNYFDQNRFYAGCKFQCSSTSNIQVGYLNVFQQLAGGNQYKNINAVRLFYFQNIDVRHVN